MNRQRSLVLKALVVLEPERAQEMARLWPDIEDPVEVSAQETVVQQRIEEIKEHGTAGRDEETAAILKQLRSQEK